MLASGDGPVGAGAFRAVNGFARQTGWLHGTAVAVASYGVVVLALLAVTYAVAARHRGEARALAATVWGVVAALLALWVNQPIAHLVGERRPFVALPDVLVLVPHGTDFGFASDHSVVAGAVATGIYLGSRRWGLAAGAVAVLVAFTRTYVGVHFVQDVVGGLLLGAAVTAIGWALVGDRLVRVVDRTAAGRWAQLVRARGLRAQSP
ncbi:MAG: Undecaprenyl-diphosphatase [Frankiales bacterium]|nr:Undecaprenyl-diphosphatase [Frankiales bacterium]